MFKLNEKGWGYGFLIFFAALFILILIGAAIGINSLSKKNKKSEPVPLEETKDYARMYGLLEDKLKNAGEYYVLDNETSLNNDGNSSKVSLTYLKSHGYINNITDPIYNTDCDGFVIIKSKDDVSAFIKCSEYKTQNYDMWS